jgi:hypothetical protein
MANNSILRGPNYSVLPGVGFSLLNGDPISGTYWLLPPGSHPIDIPALIQIRPVQPFELPMLLQNLYGFDNPYVAMLNAMNLGLVNIIGTLPGRQVNLPQGTTHIREFDAVTIRGFPVRVMVIVIQGVQSAVEVVIMVNLYRWVEFISSCLEFVNRINLLGMPSSTSHLQAVIDKTRTDQIQYQLVNPDNTAIPLTAFPTVYGNVTIINVDNSIKTGNIKGTGVVVGSHSTAKVS